MSRRTVRARISPARRSLVTGGACAERHQEYFGFSGFHNYGYWCPRTGSQREASENLVDVLVASMPDRSGTILDAAWELRPTGS
jgi:hypothetical protein